MAAPESLRDKLSQQILELFLLTKRESHLLI